MKEQDTQAEAGQTIAGAEARVNDLRRAETEMRERLSQERKAAPPSGDELRAAVAQAQAEVEGIQGRIDAAKREAKELKAEVEELERKYEEVPGAERMVEWPRLVGEKMRRLIEVRVREAAISTLEGQKWAAMGLFEEAKHRLAALEAGFHELPLEEDPRLVSLQEEMAAAAALKALKRGATKKKK